jgi:23S rRNA pseudouridine2457 synthase
LIDSTRRQYFAFYKPDQVLCQFTDQGGRLTLRDFFPVTGVYSAGRLDFNSEGLLLLTDDGTLIHRLTYPRFEHQKTYLAQVEGILSQESLQRLNQEILLPGLQTRLARARLIPVPDLPERPRPVRNYHPTTWIEIALSEGKKHQVRRMTAAVGFPTLRLVRVALGSLKLGRLKPGEWRRLAPDEIAALQHLESKAW